MLVNQKLSKVVAQRVEVRTKWGQSFNNAFKALGRLPGAVYVEGYALSGSPLKQVEHGWVEYEGQIIDPTFPKGVARYEPGLRFTGKELHEAMDTISKNLHTADLPIFYRLGWGGSESPEMMLANKRTAVALSAASE